MGSSGGSQRGLWPHLAFDVLRLTWKLFCCLKKIMCNLRKKVIVDVLNLGSFTCTKQQKNQVSSTCIAMCHTVPLLSKFHKRSKKSNGLVNYYVVVTFGYADGQVKVHETQVNLLCASLLCFHV